MSQLLSQAVLLCIVLGTHHGRVLAAERLLTLMGFLLQAGGIEGNAYVQEPITWQLAVMQTMPCRELDQTSAVLKLSSGMTVAAKHLYATLQQAAQLQQGPLRVRRPQLGAATSQHKVQLFLSKAGSLLPCFDGVSAER